MIFVTVGTGVQPFDRMLRWVDLVHTPEPLVIQCGSSTLRPEGARCIEFMPFGEVIDHMRAARAVITHAGVGSVVAALSVQKRPVVLPRRRQLGEAVDDHQLELARRLHEGGLVTLVEREDALEDALVDDRLSSQELDGGTALVADLRAYLTTYCRSGLERA